MPASRKTSGCSFCRGVLVARADSRCDLPGRASSQMEHIAQLDPIIIEPQPQRVRRSSRKPDFGTDLAVGAGTDDRIGASVRGAVRVPALCRRPDACKAAHGEHQHSAGRQKVHPWLRHLREVRRCRKPLPEERFDLVLVRRLPRATATAWIDPQHATGPAHISIPLPGASWNGHGGEACCPGAPDSQRAESLRVPDRAAAVEPSSRNDALTALA